MEDAHLQFSGRSMSEGQLATLGPRQFIGLNELAEVDSSGHHLACDLADRVLAARSKYALRALKVVQSLCSRIISVKQCHTEANYLKSRKFHLFAFFEGGVTAFDVWRMK